MQNKNLLDSVGQRPKESKLGLDGKDAPSGRPSFLQFTFPLQDWLIFSAERETDRR